MDNEVNKETENNEAETQDVSRETLEPEQPKWYIAENIPGPGDRPEWLPEKFKTVEALSKSYQELEKMHGHVPEQYELDNHVIDPAYGPLQDFAEFAKQKKVPKEVVDKALETFDKYTQEFVDDPNEELSKLGENAQKRINLVGNWVKATLPAEDAKSLLKGVRTAEQIKALENLRRNTMSNEANVPAGNEGSSNQRLSVEDVRQEMKKNYERYKQDPKYRDEIKQKFEQAVEK